MPALREMERIGGAPPCEECGAAITGGALECPKCGYIQQGGAPPEPSEAACKAAQELEFSLRWTRVLPPNAANPYSVETWRELLQAAYAVDFGRAASRPGGTG
jgi:hypothetical protein